MHTCTGHNIEPYAYGISHTRMGQPIRVWDVPYAYGPIYAYGAEHWEPDCIPATQVLPA